MSIDIAKIDSLISDSSLTNLLTGLIDIPSPTGDEKELAEHIVKQLSDFGVESNRQDIDITQANALGKISSNGNGENLLLYAPIDTVTSNSEAEDLPWVGSELRDDMRSKAYLNKSHIFGLGAHNPKGHAACILEAARVLKELNLSLNGDVYFGFGAGGMPTNSRAGKRENSGHGVGCQAMVTGEIKFDQAIIAKSGWGVSWEEVGFLWIDVEVSGIHTYVGSRHLLEYSNAIQNASRLIVKLEDWFEQRAEQKATPLIKPQAVVSFIESGWERMPAFTPASCRFRIDLRYGPDSSPEQEQQEFNEVLDNLAKELDIRVNSNVVKTIIATRTEPSLPVIQKTINAWQQVTGEQHQPIAFTSGATDANILRDNGVPTARVGLAKAQLAEIDFQLGMNCVAIADLRKVTKLLVIATLEICGESSNG